MAATAWEIAAALSRQLEADWGDHAHEAFGTMFARWGAAKNHFSVHVIAGVIVVRAKTTAALGWHRLDARTSELRLRGAQARVEDARPAVKP